MTTVGQFTVNHIQRMMARGLDIPKIYQAIEEATRRRYPIARDIQFVTRADGQGWDINISMFI